MGSYGKKPTIAWLKRSNQPLTTRKTLDLVQTAVMMDATPYPEVPFALKSIPSYERLEREELEEKSLKPRKKPKVKSDLFDGEGANKARKKEPTKTSSKWPGDIDREAKWTKKGRRTTTRGYPKNLGVAKMENR